MNTNIEGIIRETIGLIFYESEREYVEDIIEVVLEKKEEWFQFIERIMSNYSKPSFTAYKSFLLRVGYNTDKVLTYKEIEEIVDDEDITKE